MSIGERPSLASQPIDPRSFPSALRIQAGDIADSHVIGQNDDHIRPRSLSHSAEATRAHPPEETTQ